MRRIHGLSGMAFSPFLDNGQGQRGIDRRIIDQFFVRKNFLTVDPHANFLAEVIFQARQGLIETLVQGFGWVEHGRIGQLETGHTDFSFLAFKFFLNGR